VRRDVATSAAIFNLSFSSMMKDGRVDYIVCEKDGRCFLTCRAFMQHVWDDHSEDDEKEAEDDEVIFLTQVKPKLCRKLKKTAAAKTAANTQTEAKGKTRLAIQQPLPSAPGKRGSSRPKKNPDKFYPCDNCEKTFFEAKELQMHKW